MGGRDRALHAGAQRPNQPGNDRGIRLIFEEDFVAPDAVIVNRLAYVQPVPPLRFGYSTNRLDRYQTSLVQLERRALGQPVEFLRGTGPECNWSLLIRRGLLPVRGRIRIAAGATDRHFHYELVTGVPPVNAVGIVAPDTVISPSDPSVDWPALPGRITVPQSGSLLPDPFGGTSDLFLQYANATEGLFNLNSPPTPPPARIGFGPMGNGSQVLRITPPFPEPGDQSLRVAFPSNFGTSTGVSAWIDAGNQLMPNQPPFTLPPGTVIHVNQSSANLTTNWLPTGFVAGGVDDFRPPMDVMFTPRGSVAGSLAALGPQFFLVTEQAEALAARERLLAAGLYYQMNVRTQAAPARVTPLDINGQPFVETSTDPATGAVRIASERFILAVFPQTGSVQTHPIDETDVRNNITGAAIATGDGFCDDPYRFARRGIAAGK
jgi:hypothetical protein